MIIYVIRHAESEYNSRGRLQGHLDTPLSEKGREQAEKAADTLCKALEGYEISGIYSSDLERAGDTAKALVRLLAKRGEAVELEEREDLREIDLGIWQGKTKDELKAQKEEDGMSLFEKWLKDPYNNVPEKGEPMDRFFDRSINALMEIKDRGLRESSNPDKTTAVIFTHSGVVSMILNFVKGKKPRDMKKYAFSNTGGRVIEFVKGEWLDRGAFKP